MDYIYVFVLTMSYCMSPEGKTVCEKKVDTYTFTNPLDCLVLHDELDQLYEEYSNVIFYEHESGCEASGIPTTLVYPSEEDAKAEGQEMLDVVKLMLE